jgi:tetratricopeptide (TPR) repeat protein
MKEDLKSSLLNLQGLEFIYEKSLFPELEYIFRHVLTQEVAYNSLLLKRRKEIHEKIGMAIEEIYPGRLEEFYGMLAYHYSKSGNLPKAYEYLKESASKAVRNDALFESIRFYKEGIEVLTQLPQTHDNKREQIELVLAMQVPWRRMGYSEDYLPLLQNAEKLAEEFDDEKNRIQIRSILGIYYITKGGDAQLAWKYLESCEEHLGIIEDLELIVQVGFNLCIAWIFSGDWKRINDVAPTIVRLIENSKAQDEFFGSPFCIYSYLLAVWGAAKGGSGDFNQGKLLCEKALSVANKIDHRATKGIVEYVYGITLGMKGDAHRAARHLKKAIKNLEESQAIVFVGLAWGWLGYAHCLMGEYKSALDLTEKALRMHTDLGMSFWRSWCHWCCSSAHFDLGHTEQARIHAELALQFSIENKERQCEGFARAWLGRVVSKTNPTHIEAAEQHLLQGIDLLEELGIVAEYSIGYLWLGEVYAESGRREEAVENLKKAESMFQEMCMDYWLGKTKEVLGRL